MFLFWQVALSLGPIKYVHIIIIVIIIALGNVPYKMLHKRVRAPSEKTNSEQVRLQVFCKKIMDLTSKKSFFARKERWLWIFPWMENYPKVTNWDKSCHED